MTVLHTGLCRGDDAMRIHLADMCVPHTIKTVGPSKFEVLSVLLHAGKTSSQGAQMKAYLPRHKDYRQCVVSALGRYLYFRFRNKSEVCGSSLCIEWPTLHASQHSNTTRQPYILLSRHQHANQKQCVPFVAQVMLDPEECWEEWLKVPLFPARDGTEMKPGTLYNQITKLFEDVGIVIGKKRHAPRGSHSHALQGQG